MSTTVGPLKLLRDITLLLLSASEVHRTINCLHQNIYFSTFYYANEMYGTATKYCMLGFTVQTRYTVLNFVNFPHFTSNNKVAQSEVIRLNKISLRGRTLIKRSVGCILPPPPPPPQQQPIIFRNSHYTLLILALIVNFTGQSRLAVYLNYI